MIYWADLLSSFLDIQRKTKFLIAILDKSISYVYCLCVSYAIVKIPEIG
jgi:hypothetical protein